MSSLRAAGVVVVLFIAVSGGRGGALSGGQSQPSASLAPPPKALGLQAPLDLESMATMDLLRRYTSGEHDILLRLPQPMKFNVRTISADLKKMAASWLSSPGFAPGAARRALAGFAFETGNAGMLSQRDDAIGLLTWTLDRLIVPHTPGDDFDRLWLHAVIVLFENVRDVGIAEKAVAAALKKFPDEPRYVLARAWAEEQKLSTQLAANVKLSDGKLADVFARLTDAMAFPEVRGEAALRYGRIELATQRYEPALRHFDEAEPHLREPALQYLLQLFRGRALSLLDRSSGAEAAYHAALVVRPGAQSATLGLAQLAFLRGERDRADAIVGEMIARDAAPNDPWQIYDRGDARLATRIVAALHEAIK